MRLSYGTFTARRLLLPLQQHQLTARVTVRTRYQIYRKSKAGGGSPDTPAASMATEMTNHKGKPFDRDAFENLMRRRFFYRQSFDLYGGIQGVSTRGFFDYGPPGCSLQTNMLDAWRKHFVIEEDMLELDMPAVTPYEVLKTSGHVDKFSDFMCKDPKSGEFFRADHLVKGELEARLKGNKEAQGVAQAPETEDPKANANTRKKDKKVKTKAVKLDDATVQEFESILAKLDNYSGPELGDLIKKYKMGNPETGQELEPPIAFNLMFQTTIGPGSSFPGYLRPETAQGQFLNFDKLLEFNDQKMPFASASIGKSFRNEISPRSGLLRVREFLMAEIEHFVDPQGGKRHPRFAEVKDEVLSLLDRDVQLSGKTTLREMSIGEAVHQKIVDNETLGYFLARIQQYALKIGIDRSKMRFRQHMANEMAHYATDCWDLELLNSYGWIEIVGCADRSAYDLTVHQNRTQKPLRVQEQLATPVKVEEWQIDIEAKKFRPAFRKDAAAVEKALDALSDEVREKLSLELKKEGKFSVDVPGVGNGKVEITKEMVPAIERRTRTENTRTYTPNVIEPSFGVGRLLYTLMEHVYWTRPEDEARGVLSFPPPLAPTKVLIVPISKNESFTPLIASLSSTLRKLGVSNRIDASSASIGKRYARNDELGTPLGITVDFQSVQDGTVTLRDRDTTKQVRGSEKEVVHWVVEVSQGRATWKDIAASLKEFKEQVVS